MRQIKNYFTFVNIVIKGGSKSSAVFKMDHSVVIVLHRKPLTFVAERWVLERR